MMVPVRLALLVSSLLLLELRAVISVVAVQKSLKLWQVSTSNASFVTLEPIVLMEAIVKFVQPIPILKIMGHVNVSLVVPVLKYRLLLDSMSVVNSANQDISPTTTELAKSVHSTHLRPLPEPLNVSPVPVDLMEIF